MVEEGKNIDLPMEPLNTSECSVCGCEIDVRGMPPLTQIECPDCTSLETVPGRFGPFLILSLIGAGGMGSVYKAKDETLGRLVAIKVVLPSVAENREFLETFKREAQAAAKLNHPHIAQIYSFGQYANQPYIVMELVDGKCFDKMFDADNPLSQGKVMRIGLDIAEGLQAADEIGLIHGDIKPENILLNEKNEAKLVDFGIASFAQKQAGDGIWGTPYYIAPEKIQRKKVDARSDIYCLGGTLYHALTGQPPFDGDTPVDVVKVRLTEDPVPPKELNSKIDPSVENIIKRMLQREPSRRYPNYGSLITDLRKAASKFGSKKGPLGTVSRGAGKKVILTKKRPAGGSASGEKTSSSSSGKSSSKKTIKGKKTYSRVKASADQSSAVKKHLEERKASGAGEAAKKKSGSGKKKFIKFLVVLFIIGCASGAYYLYDKSQKKKATQIAAYNLGLRKKNASDLLEEMAKTAKKIENLGDSGKAMVATVSNSVFVILEESLTYQLEPKSKLQKKEEKTKEKTEEKKDDGPTPEKITNLKEEKEAAKKDEEEKAQKESMDRGVPMGVSEEHLRRLRGEAPKEEEKPEEEEEEIEPEETPEPTQVKADDPEIKKAAIDTIREVQKLLNERLRARRTFSKAEKLSEKIQNATIITTTVEPFKDMKEEKQTLKEHLKTIEEKIKEAEKFADNVAQLKKQELKRRENERLAAEEAERLRLERERKEREEQARQQRVAEQIAKAKAMRVEYVPLVKEFRFYEILEKVVAEESAFTEPEGKAAFDLVKERYMHLYRLKKILVQHLNHYPFAWGWGTGVSSIDIISATSEHIKLKSRTVPWEKVRIAQLLKIIDHYVDRNTYRQEEGKHAQQFTMPKLSTKKSEPWVKISFIRLLGEMNMAAAIFCTESGGAKGKDKADRYSRQAATLCSDLEDDILRLVTVPGEE